MRARATIVAPPGARFVRWPHRAFVQLQTEEGSDFAANVQLMIARTLSAKLSSARLQARDAAVLSLGPDSEIYQLRLQLAAARCELGAFKKRERGDGGRGHDENERSGSGSSAVVGPTCVSALPRYSDWPPKPSGGIGAEAPGT